MIFLLLTMIANVQLVSTISILALLENIIGIDSILGNTLGESSLLEDTLSDNYILKTLSDVENALEGENGLVNNILQEVGVVTSALGVLIGTTMEARNGRMYNAFFNIPYAEPPVGKLRFQPPKKPKPWSGTRNCTSPPVPCIQMTKGASYVIGEEDCLYLNVYSPANTQKGDNLSVIFYLYGGVYKSGDNVRFGANYIMGSNVILVQPNFREGALGFLSTGDTVITGNFALKDQTMALKWVQQNIYDFGGDPSKVTLHGHSSGAVNAHMHTLSPLSTGLFNQLIVQSGTALCSLSYFDTATARDVAIQFAQLLNCPTTTSQEMLDCFLALDASLFPKTAEQLYIWDIDPDAAFRPSVEDSQVEGAFLTDVPHKLKYQRTDVPWLIGLTTGEGAFKAARYLSGNGSLVKQLNSEYETLFPVTLQYLWNTETTYLNYASETLRKYYFQDQEIGPNTEDQLTQLYTQGLFGICVVEAIKNYDGEKYVYWYNYQSNYSCQNTAGYYPKILGVSHGDDIYLIFCVSDSAPYLTKVDIKFSDEVIKRWVNFVQSGDPNQPTQIDKNVFGFWEPMTSDRIEYLKIQINGTMETDLYKELYRFWRSLPLFSKYFLN